MFVKCKSRKIEDHDLVTARVDITAPDENITPWLQVTFTHGYVNEMEKKPPLPIYNNLNNIDDTCATICIRLNESEKSDLMNNHNSPNINSEDNLQISIVEVRRFDKKWNLSEDDKFKIAQIFKNRGIEKFKAHQWVPAFKNFLRGSRYLYGTVSVTDLKHPYFSNEARTLLISCLNNTSLACLKLQSGYKLCIKYSDNVLKMEPANSKAFYRKAKAQYLLNNPGDAISTINEGILVQRSIENMQEFVQLKQRCYELHKKQNEYEKDVYKSVFDKLGELAKYAPDDDEPIIPEGVGDWDNAMADELMSINEELEAFGEQMPPRKGKIKDIVTTIIEEVDDEDGIEDM